MASGTTYQSLERLTHMPSRDGEQGDRIAAQFYYDIYVTGGALANVSLTDVTINGITTTPNLRYITVGGDVTVLPTDCAIILNKTIGAATTIFLPTSPSDSQLIIAKDAKGDANTHNITIDGNGNTIDGGATLVIGSPYGGNQLLWNSSEWSVIA